MMKKIIILTTMFLTFTPCSVQAENINVPIVGTEIENAKDVACPCADIIETKYRICNGKVQYRRWNTSKLCWVDSNWHDL